MNKLISRNPIQRFKEGRKIQKFQEAGKIYYKGRDGINYEAFSGPKGWYYRKKGTQDTFRMPKDYVTTTGIRFYDSNGNMINNPSSNSNPKNDLGASVGAAVASTILDKNRVAQRHDYDRGQVTYKQDKNGIWYAKWNNSDLPNQGYYRVAEGSTGYDKLGNHNVLRNGQWVKIDETPVETVKNISIPYQFGKMGGWNRSMGSSIDQDSLNMIKEMGMEGKSAQDIQNEINRVFGSNAVKADNRWGNQSRAGLKALYENWKISQPSTAETKPTITQPSITQTPEFQERLRQQFIKEETPEQQTDRAIVNNVDNLQFKRNGNYNKSGIRDLIRNYGLRAYDFTGAQRKALRQYLNGESNDTSLLTNGLERFIVPYKQGGQLPSRNIVKRFKNRKFN